MGLIMAGKKVRKGLGKIITERVNVLNAMGEAEVWATYAELGGVQKMCNQLFKPHGEGAKTVGTSAFYAWLDSDETGERRRKWTERKAWRSHDLVERAEQALEDVSPENATAVRTQVDGLLRVAGSINRKDYGKQVDVAVTHNAGESFVEAMNALEALRSADDPHRTQIESQTVLEGEYTVEGETDDVEGLGGVDG